MNNILIYTFILMSEQWFDTSHFDVVAGVPVEPDIAAQRLATGDETVMHIGELLIATDFTDINEDNAEFREQRELRRAEIRTWDKDKMREYGAWIKGLVESVDTEAQPITQGQLTRMSILGLGAEILRLKQVLDIKYLAEFRQQLGVPLGNIPNRFTHWDIDRYIAYARALTVEVGGKLQPHHLNTAAKLGNGPSCYHLQKSVVRSLANLNDLLGFPDVESMDDTDMIYWGVRVMKANNGQGVTRPILEILSGRGRGPSEAPVRLRFGGIRNFRDAVKVQFELDNAYDAELREAKLVLYDKMIANGELPEEYRDLSEGVLLEIAGRYRLVDRCLPHLEDEEKLAIAQHLTQDVASDIKRKSWSTISRGHVEREAIVLGIFDDVWPMDEGLEYLKVSGEELAVVRSKNALRARRAIKARRQRQST